MSRAESLHGSLILADHQRKGRGQYERNWEAEPGKNLTFSLIFEPATSDRLTILTLACAFAISEVCEDLTQEIFQLKWPNDLLVKGKKIGGLLTEAIFNGSDLERVVIGIGLNVNQKLFSQDIEKEAISLAFIKNEYLCRETVLTRILTKIEYYYRLWDRYDIELLKSINKKMIGYGDWASLTVNGESKEGEFKFLGVNEKGCLVVLNKELEVNTFSYEQVRVHFDS
ncbi:MAG: biotin--[acetyl-CoA-carboxylase] ligase [Balneolales bacterium]|nr:biotin--[acetyl-CoA-carboxylase] ligase [Balneolales bacterium]